MTQDDWSFEFGRGPWVRVEAQTPSDPVVNEVRLSFIDADGRVVEGATLHVSDEDEPKLVRILLRTRKMETT